MAATDYRFTFADFDPNRPLSKCRAEPRMAGYIRWLRMRAELLLPYGLPLEESELAHEWWDEMESEDFRWQRGMQCSHHARFDLDPDGDWDEYEFPANVSAMSAWVDSHTLLHSDAADPVRKCRVWLDDGTQHRVKVRFHEMLADKARSDLYEAIGLLIRGSTERTPDSIRLEHEREALTLVIGAAELVNRAEQHAQASKSKAKATRTGTVPESNTTRISRRVDSQTQEKAQKDERREPWIEVHSSYLQIAYGGKRCCIDKIRRMGALKLGFSCLIDLLQEPWVDMSPLTLFANFKNSEIPQHLSGNVQKAAQYAVDTDELAGRERLNRGDLVKRFPGLEKRLRKIKRLRDEGETEQADEMMAAFTEECNVWTASHKAKGTLVGKKEHKVIDEPVDRERIRTVGRALNDVLKRLNQDFPEFREFREHLSASLTRRYVDKIVYRPIPNVVWEKYEVT